MKKISILDCTLRDGGYVNEWNFGKEKIALIKEGLENIKMEVIELGFLRNEPYSENRSIFNTISSVNPILEERKKGVVYSLMAEMANEYPLSMLTKRENSTIDIIRYAFWKRKIDEAYEYAKGIAEKGYLLGVQPTRIEQYSKEEFAQLCKKFSQLHPLAIYVVDTFGLLKKKDFIEYVRIADQYIGQDTAIGYHAHNNMQQAFSNAVTFVELDLQHDIMIDVSAFGMGRGAGNLNSELMLHYLNEQYNKDYNISYLYQLWDKAIKNIYENYEWGYNLYYFIAASNACNPLYASYFINKNVTLTHFMKIIELIQGSDKYLYSAEKAEAYYSSTISWRNEK